MMMNDNAQYHGPGDLLRQPPFARRKPLSMAKSLSRIPRRRDFDDDDPPPCPATASIPKRLLFVDARAA
jgi:hypothetical protein